MKRPGSVVLVKVVNMALIVANIASWILSIAEETKVNTNFPYHRLITYLGDKQNWLPPQDRTGPREPSLLRGGAAL